MLGFCLLRPFAGCSQYRKMLSRKPRFRDRDRFRVRVRVRVCVRVRVRVRVRVGVSVEVRVRVNLFGLKVAYIVSPMNDNA